MGISKTDNYSTKELAISAYAKALAHPARIAIIHYLLNKKECVCGRYCRGAAHCPSHRFATLKRVKENWFDKRHTQWTKNLLLHKYGCVAKSRERIFLAV
jgi:hypothetical protein